MASESKPKGSYGAECNRRACTNPCATWYNKSTRKYYCETCAALLNHVTPQLETKYLFDGLICVNHDTSNL